MSRFDPRLAALLEDELAASGLLPHLRDPEVTDLMVNEDGSVYLQTLGRGQSRVDGLRLAPAEIETLLATVASLHDTVVTADEPVLEATLPIANARLEALLPPLVASPVLALRKPPARLLTLADLVANGTLPAPLADDLSQAFRHQCTIVIAGGVGSGKTTLANAFLADLVAHHPDERIVVLEEGARELHVEAGNVVRLLTSERAGIGMGRLVRTALRLNPSRLLIGEARGPEALDWLRAANTGHAGSLLTTHANGARQALDRLDALVQEAGVPSQRTRIEAAVDYVVFVSLTAGGHRRVLEVIEAGEGDDGGTAFHTLYTVAGTDPGETPVPSAAGSTPTPRPKEAPPMRVPRRADVLAALTALAWPLVARATEAGGSMPWNAPLDTLRENLTGPTATVLILIALTFAFVLWAFSDNHHGLMKAFKAMIALAVIATIGTFLGSLGINAATL